MLKSVTVPASSRTAVANSADPGRLSSSPRAQDARSSAASRPSASRVPRAWAQTSASVASWRRSGPENSASGSGQQTSMAPSAMPEPAPAPGSAGSGSTARAPPGQGPISGALSPGGRPPGHQESRPPRAARCSTPSISG